MCASVSVSFVTKAGSLFSVSRADDDRSKRRGGRMGRNEWERTRETGEEEKIGDFPDHPVTWERRWRLSRPTLDQVIARRIWPTSYEKRAVRWAESSLPIFSLRAFIEPLEGRSSHFSMSKILSSLFREALEAWNCHRPGKDIVTFNRVTSSAYLFYTDAEVHLC